MYEYRTARHSYEERREAALQKVGPLAAKVACWLDSEFYDGEKHEQVFPGGRLAVWRIFDGSKGYERAAIDVYFDGDMDVADREPTTEKLIAKVAGDKLVRIEGTGTSGEFIPFEDMSVLALEYDVRFMERLLGAVTQTDTVAAS